MIHKYLQLNKILRPPPNINSFPSYLTKPIMYQITASPALAAHPLYISYLRLTVNSRLSVLLSQLRTIVANKGKDSKEREKIIELIMQTFHNMDVDTVRAKNLQNIVQIVSGLQKTDKDSKNNPLITKMKQKLNALKNIKQQTPTEILINLYTSAFHKEHQVQATKICQEIITHLNQSSKIDLKVQTITRFLEYIKKKSISDHDRQVRMALLRKVRSCIGTYSKQEILNLAFILNSISHCDFQEEQLKIVEQIFVKAEESFDEKDKNSIDIISDICRREQCLTNKHSLSSLLANLIRSYLSTIKRNNSAEAHQIFQLITIANRKLLKSQSKDDKIQAFVLQYILISGKTKKHNKTINQALQKLIPYFFSQSHIQLLVEILTEINFKMYPIVFYQLANRSAEVERLKPSFDDKSQDATLLLTVAFNMNKTLSESNQAKQLKNRTKQLLEQQFLKVFTILIAIKDNPATDFIKNFDKIFGQNFKILFQQYLPRLLSNQYTGISNFFRYFLFSSQNLSLHYQKIQEYLAKTPKQEARKIISHLIDTQPNENFGKLLYLLRSDYNQQNPRDETFFHIITKANQCYRQGLLTLDEQTQYWTILQSFLNYFLHQPATAPHMKQYPSFLATIFKRYNNSYSDFLESNSFRRIFSMYFSPHFEKIQLYPQLRTIFTKFIVFNKVLPQNMSLSMSDFNLKELDQTQKQILKSMLSKRYNPQIGIIDQATLPIILYNRNLHHLLKSRSEECIQVIRRSNASALANYVMSMRAHAYQIYPQIACIILDVLADKVDFATVKMFPYLRALITADLTLTPSCTKFMKCYLQYLTSTPNRTQDYNTTLIILHIIRSQYLPKYLTNSYISQILRKSGEYREWQICALCQKILLTNYIFSPQQLELMAKFAPAKAALLYLDEFWNREQKERLLERIIQREKQFNRLQIKYMNERYPQQSKKIKIYSIQPLEQIKTKPEDQKKLNQLATLCNSKITTILFYQDKLFSIRGKIVAFVSPFYRNSIHLISYLDKAIKIKFGDRTQLSIMFGFPESYSHISQTLRPPYVFYLQQWRNFFNNMPTTESQQPQSKEKNEESVQNSQSVPKKDQILFPDEEYKKDVGESNKKSRRRRGFFKRNYDFM